jgi:ribosomal protein S11
MGMNSFNKKSGKALARVGMILLGIFTTLVLSTCINPLDEMITQDISVKFGEITVIISQEELLSGEGVFDFGEISLGSSSEPVEIIIENSGQADLELTDESLVLIEGDAADDFTVVNLPARIVTAGNTTSFTIAFGPTDLGERSCTISIPASDGAEEPFSFSVKGTGILGDFYVTREDGTTTVPHSIGEYDYGSVHGGNPETASFIIHNTGTDNVDLTGTPVVNISGSGASAYSVPTYPTSIITGGSTSTFTVRFSPTVSSETTATVEIPYFGTEAKTYTFTVKGSGIFPGAPTVSGDAATLDTTPTWSWTSGGGGDGNYRYKMDNSDLSTGASDIAGTSYTPGSALSLGTHTLYVQERNSYGAYGSTGSFAINVVDVMAVGWLGGGSNGWKTGTAPSYGSDLRSFEAPSDVFIDGSGNFYIADTSNNRICKWDSSGNAVGWIGGGYDGWQTGAAPSSYGSDYRSFRTPAAVWVYNDTIYVAEMHNHRISKWDSTTGAAIGWIGGGLDGWQTGTAPATGTGYKWFSTTNDVCVDGSGNIYVTDYSNNRICKWADATGTAIGWIGGGYDGWQTATAPPQGSGYKYFYIPLAVTIDGSGNIFVADYANNRICKWADATGTAIGWIGGGYDGWQTATAPSQGSGYKYFRYPSSISVDSSGNIYVTDAYYHRICKWNSSGIAQGWIGGGSNGWHTSDAPWHNEGTGMSSFYDPLGNYIDGSGNIFIADSTNARISKWEQAP